jgi:hypothetical protein
MAFVGSHFVVGKNGNFAFDFVVGVVPRPYRHHHADLIITITR